MPYRYSAHFLTHVSEYIAGLDDATQGKIAANLEVMRTGDLITPHTKQLQGHLHELIIGNHRLIYFVIKSAVYFVCGFRKKTRKTPKREIEYALAIHRNLKHIEV